MNIHDEKILNYILNNPDSNLEEIIKHLPDEKYDTKERINEFVKSKYLFFREQWKQYVNTGQKERILSFRLSPQGKLALHNYQLENKRLRKLYWLNVFIKSFSIPIVVSIVTTLIVYYLANRFQLFAVIFRETQRIR